MYRFIEWLLNYQLVNQFLPAKKREAYIYAYTILLEECINVALAIIIGIIFGKLFLVIIFLCAYIPLRTYAGGYHADSAFRCILVSVIILITLCSVYDVVADERYILFGYILLVISQIVICCLVPIDTENKWLTDKEKRKNQKKSREILAIQISVIICGTILKRRQIYMGISYAHIILNGMLIIGYYKNHRLTMKNPKKVIE